MSKINARNTHSIEYSTSKVEVFGTACRSLVFPKYGKSEQLLRELTDQKPIIWFF